MEVFNIISGVCSIAGLAVSLFTAGKIIKISQSINYGNKDDRSKVINKGEGNTYNGSYTGRTGLEVLFKPGRVSYIKHGYSSINSANKASVLPVNKVPPPFSSSSIEVMVSVLGISSGTAAPCR